MTLDAGEVAGEVAGEPWVVFTGEFSVTFCVVAVVLFNNGEPPKEFVVSLFVAFSKPAPAAAGLAVPVAGLAGPLAGPAGPLAGSAGLSAEGAARGGMPAIVVKLTTGELPGPMVSSGGIPPPRVLADPLCACVPLFSWGSAVKLARWMTGESDVVAFAAVAFSTGALGANVGGDGGDSGGDCGDCGGDCGGDSCGGDGGDCGGGGRSGAGGGGGGSWGGGLGCPLTLI